MSNTEYALPRRPHQIGSHAECILAGVHAEVFQFPQVITLHIVRGKILKFREVDHVFLANDSQYTVDGIQHTGAKTRVVFRLFVSATAEGRVGPKDCSRPVYPMPSTVSRNLVLEGGVEPPRRVTGGRF